MLIVVSLPLVYPVPALKHAHMSLSGIQNVLSWGVLVLAYMAGCSGYISKPIDTRSFAKTVAGFLMSQ